ncbi:Histidine kinase-, DNA gyrase B-, and HSP90-like ATPase [Roseovarius lutimaris]|uniref:Histidine kinase-, DNA gyrase B-, and HSP90-like ATPase n=1 Tax=Roseovarius lutimaris TaxID=1005928 RepID=A0A1I5GZQ6_9RHOB|nr:Histidine kinase-, DNA gyrase B-, and HSP90-like ATPase [Roseovarius lutimaris]
MPISVNEKTQELEGNIRNSLVDGTAAEGRLETNDRIIARVTDGIYREPWSAFRELVSNAYDADATSVSIDCDYPFFNEVRISDDGIGMDSQTVADLLTNIGGSSKRTFRGKSLGTVNTSDPTESPSGRKLIGKIGIGLFAVAQLTNHFQIITKRKGNSERISATVKINTYRENAHTDEADETYASGTYKVVAEKTSDIDAHGTTIVLMNIQRAVREKLQSREIWDALDEQENEETFGLFDIVSKPNFHIGRVGANGELSIPSSLPWTATDSPKEKFQKLFDRTIELGRNSSDRTDLSHLDNYLKMVWRLSLGSPIKYLETHPFEFTGLTNFDFFELSNKPKGGASRIDLTGDQSIRTAMGLEAGTKDPLSEFTVFIDGVELFRPVKLSEVLQGSKNLPRPMFFAGKVETNFGDASADRSGGKLAFEAYLYWNSKIIPKESIGALIRVNGASGTLFDPDFLGYQIAEQTRKKQVTCEIFVLEGLDGALNIDRESYNTSHAHYLYIQKWLHNAFRQFATQHKKIGREVREIEIERISTDVTSKLTDIAGEVWERMRGDDIGLPTIETRPLNHGDSLPVKVGGNEISWDQPRIKERRIGRPDRIEAISIILDAYGILELLDDERRADLLFDIATIFEDDA